MRPGSLLHIAAAGLVLGGAHVARADSPPDDPCFDEPQVTAGSIPANAPSLRLRVPSDPTQVGDITLTQIVGELAAPLPFERTDERLRDGFHVVLTPDTPFTAGARLIVRRAHCGGEPQQTEIDVGPPVDLPAPPATLALRTLGVALGGGVDHYEVEIQLSPGAGSLDTWVPYLAIASDIGGAMAEQERIFGNAAYLYASVDCRDRVGLVDEGERVPVGVRLELRGTLETLVDAHDAFDIDCDDATFVALLPNGVRRPLTAAELAELDPDRRPFEVDAGPPLAPDAGTSTPPPASSGCAIHAPAGGAPSALAAMLSALAIVAARGRARRPWR